MMLNPFRRTAGTIWAFIAVLSLLFLLGVVSGGTPAQSQPAVADLEARIDGLLGQMTVQEKVEQLFYKTDGNTRLGIPQFQGSDGPHGIGNGAKGWSCFPVTLAMTATWDPGLIQRVGRAIALEQASRGRHRLAGPVLDLLSDPRNGRASETIGEDPFLGGRITEGFLRGMNETAVFGTIKHYNLNTYEANRETNNYRIDQRSLVEFWGAHWRRAIQDGGALSVMCAYNLVNGDKCAENYNLIKTILRDLWGFRGYTMCDWGGFWSTEKAMAAELDFCEGNELYIKQLPGLVAEGKITQTQLDNAVRNVLRTKILAGMLDGQPGVPETVRDCPEHRALVYESGLKSIVLLKNQDAILPLSPKLKSVALIGPSAATLPLDGHSSSAVIPSYTITPKQGLETLLGAERVRYAKGCDINSKDRSLFAEAQRIARESEVVIFIGGLDNTVEGEGYFIKGDRLTGSVDLPGVQNDLINELAAVNPNLVLVVISGGPCAVNKVIKNVKGLLYACYPGQEGGHALADLLCGRENPCGKLPVTIPKSDEQLPPRDTDFREVAIQGVGYRWFDRQKIQPEFAFGFGLSYTTFAYDHLQVTPGPATINDAVVVSVDVTNTGKRSGEEVAQLYLITERLDPPFPMPVKQLKGFSKVLLQPGETRRVTFRLAPKELYVFDADQGRYRVPAGQYRVGVGGASDNLPVSGRFTLGPAPERPDFQILQVRTVPPFPSTGDQTHFVASVVNRGTGPAAATPSVEFRVDGRLIAVGGGNQTPIPVGGMMLVESENSTFSCQPGVERYIMEATVDTREEIKETDESNNTVKRILISNRGMRAVRQPQ
ncbi:MAG: glycoside hydrolase family 3 C-terminal domain-containing protein [Sedimentisphaerales bacterium]|nr:glycoside hydrolase family 3 C-terminal domain-containing protein [Sedimentisphaerales bacterium]